MSSRPTRSSQSFSTCGANSNTSQINAPPSAVSGLPPSHSSFSIGMRLDVNILLKAAAERSPNPQSAKWSDVSADGPSGRIICTKFSSSSAFSPPSSASPKISSELSSPSAISARAKASPPSSPMLVAPICSMVSVVAPAPPSLHNAAASAFAPLTPKGLPPRRSSASDVRLPPAEMAIATVFSATSVS